MSKIKNILRLYLPFAVVISAFCLLTYTAIQQVYRQAANDPQIQMANDAADCPRRRRVPSSRCCPSFMVSVAKSLSPFLIFYDAQGNVTGSTAVLDGQTPALPAGVLESTVQMGGENRRTWQPRAGVRIAAVIVSYKDGFVLAGRSLRESEARTAQLGTMTGLTWLLAMAVTLAAIAFGEFFLRGKEN